MKPLNGKKVTEVEKVIHVAYGCGCVRTFHVKHQSSDTRCLIHGDPQISFTEEYQPKNRTAA